MNNKEFLSTVSSSKHNSTCLALEVNDIISNLADKKTPNLIAEFSQALGANSGVVKELRQVYVTNNAIVLEKLHEAADTYQSGSKSLRAMSKDDVAGLAAKHSITPRDINGWRKAELLITLSKKPATRDETAACLFTSGDTLEKMLNEQIAAGAIVKNGDLYDLSESTRQQLAEVGSVSSN